MASAAGLTAWQSCKSELEEDIWREEFRRTIAGEGGDSTMNSEGNIDLAIKPDTASMQEKTNIADSIIFEGELEAHEDVLIQGRIKGSIAAEGHDVRIAREASVDGEILANRLIVEGGVNGTVTGKEKVVLKQAADVKGEIYSPKLALEEGCKFDGKVKMD